MRSLVFTQYHTQNNNIYQFDFHTSFICDYNTLKRSVNSSRVSRMVSPTSLARLPSVLIYSSTSSFSELRGEPSCDGERKEEELLDMRLNLDLLEVSPAVNVLLPLCLVMLMGLVYVCSNFLSIAVRADLYTSEQI